MARVPLVPDDQTPWWVRIVKSVVNRKLRLNQPSEGLNLMAHHPGVAFAFTAYMGSLDRWDRLPLRLKRLVHLRVAMRVGCPF
jgi:hypothetical protein